MTRRAGSGTRTSATACCSPKDACCTKRPTGTARWRADNVGWRDQRYFGNYERIGLFRITGLWDEIPQFYSVDTRTAFTEAEDGVLLLDDNAQRAASHNAYLSISPQFDLRERRDIGTFRVSATPTVNVDVTGGFTTTKHSGELPWGASFGFSNDNEVALPYRSRTNDMDVGLQWTNTRAMFRAAYNGSWFNNQADTLTWDNPLVLTDSTSASGRGRMALWPSNSLQTLSAAGYAKFARRTQLTGSLAFGWANNDEPLLPFTINSALPQLPLPRATADASATTVATTSAWCRARSKTGGSAPGSAATTTTTACLTLRLATSSATTPRWGRARLAGHCSMRTPATRSMPTPRGPASGSWRSPSHTPTTTTATTFASSSRRTRTCCSSRQTRSVSGG